MDIELIELKDIRAIPDIVHLYPERVKSECTPLVIDNGLLLTICNIFIVIYSIILLLLLSFFVIVLSF